MKSCSRTWAPWVTNHTPSEGVAPASKMPWTRAKALAVALATSSAISSVVAPAPWPSNAVRWTTPLRAGSLGKPLSRRCQSPRRDTSIFAGTILGSAKESSPGPPSSPARMTVWPRETRSAARLSAVPSWSEARTQMPGDKSTSSGPRAIMMLEPRVWSASGVSGPINFTLE